MKTLQTRVNLVPLISKADMLTPKEIKKFKKRILDELAKHQIRIYQVNSNYSAAGPSFFYRSDLEKQEGCGVVAHERLTEPRATME